MALEVGKLYKIRDHLPRLSYRILEGALTLYSSSMTSKLPVIGDPAGGTRCTKLVDRFLFLEQRLNLNNRRLWEIFFLNQNGKIALFKFANSVDIDNDRYFEKIGKEECKQ